MTTPRRHLGEETTRKCIPVIKAAISLGQQIARVSSLQALLTHGLLCLNLQRWGLATEVQIWTVWPTSYAGTAIPIRPFHHLKPSLLQQGWTPALLWSKEGLIWGEKREKRMFWNIRGMRGYCILKKEGKGSQRKGERGKGVWKEHILHLHWALLVPLQHHKPFHSPVPSQRWSQKLQTLYEMRHFFSFKSGWCLV